MYKGKQGNTEVLVPQNWTTLEGMCLVEQKYVPGSKQVYDKWSL